MRGREQPGLWALASFPCGQGKVPYLGEVITARQRGGIFTTNKRGGLAFTALDLLEAIIVVPEKDHPKISRIAEFVAVIIREGTRLGATVTGFLFNLAHGALERSFSGFYVTTGYDPQAGIVDRGNVVAMLEQGGAVGPQDDDPTDGGFWRRARVHEAEGGRLARQIQRKFEAKLNPVEKLTAKMAAGM